MAAPRRALIVATAAPTFRGSDTTAGCYAEELAAPYNAWAAAGFDIDIATPSGDAITWTPNSLKGDAKTKAVDEFFANEAALAKTKKPMAVHNADASRYDIVYVPGGHGAMVDLPESVEVQQLLSKAWSRGAVVASVCHGPAALVNVVDANGAPLLRGRRVSCFTNEEEESVKMTQTVPFLLEDAVKAKGALFEHTSAMNSHVVRDGRLVTGQNPASASKLAAVVLEAVSDTQGERKASTGGGGA